MDLDDDTWARARGWMLWKAAITLRDACDETPDAVGTAGEKFGWRIGAQQVLEDVMAEHAGNRTFPDHERTTDTSPQQSY